MPFEANNGLGGVSNFYGPRETGGSIGSEETETSVRNYSIAFTGESLNSTYLPPVVLPRGSKFLRATLRVDEAFSLGGTTPTVIFGGTSPATNGIVLSQAELQAVGTKTPTSTGTGTWAVGSATGTTAAERVTRALGGTSPTVSRTAGKATLVVEFINKTKV